MSKKLEDLLKKREQLNAEIQKVRARQTAQERKEETRRKILLGALVKEMMANGELDEGMIMKRLSGFLTRDLDRKLFDLTVEGKEKETKPMLDPSDPEIELTYEVILEKFPVRRKKAILEVLQGVIGLELKEAQEVIDSTPSLVTATNQEKAELIKKQLEELGATVELTVSA